MAEGNDQQGKPTPPYVLRWLHKRVRWVDGQRQRSGVVTDVHQVTWYGLRATTLRVAGDDGFLHVGVDADVVTEDVRRS